MSDFDYKMPPINFFNQSINKITPIGGQGSQGVVGVGKIAGTQRGSGGSAVDRELADMRRFIPAYNGTGELRPNNAEDGAKLQMLYA